MEFRNGFIHGVEHQQLEQFSDDRGDLTELFRQDYMPVGCNPVMGYTSRTRPGVVRGPHEHRHQTDVFVFAGIFEIFLWDARQNSRTCQLRTKIVTVAKSLYRVIVPPGVVHAYRVPESLDSPQLSFNFPNRLFKGPGRVEEIDEIRYEDATDSPYIPW